MIAKGTVQADGDRFLRETCFLLLDDDAVKADEDLSLTLWDNDKRSADDLIGRVQIPVRELLAKPNQDFTRTDGLTGFEQADTMIGKLTWSVSYYEKTSFDSSRKAPQPEKSEQQADEDARSQKGKGKSKDKADARNTPPDEDFPSGVLSVIVHHINNLERQNLKGIVTYFMTRSM
jgi:Ca2+-dependent lipid-binding protein